MASNSPSSRRAALVTGGTGGIGSGVAMALTQHGFDVVVGDRAIEPAAADDLRARAADVAFAAFGRLDCLVNNAGVSTWRRTATTSTSPSTPAGPFF